MLIIADDLSFGNSVFPEAEWHSVPLSKLSGAQGHLFLVERLFDSPQTVTTAETAIEDWETAFMVGHSLRSQFDLLVEACSSQVRLPDRIISLAGSGQGFHGQRGRPWMAERGNLHLSVLLQPRRIISRVHVVFPLLAAVSVLQTLDELDDFRTRAGVKWVNDILVDGAKVAGFITQIQSQEREVKAVVLGIGMNVGASPLVAADPFARRVASLDSFLPQGRTCSLSRILSGLLSQLSQNYQLILAGKTSLLLDFYRQRSLVLGRRIRVISDPVSGESHELISGRAVKIGENLELYLENRKEPVTHGRLILED